MEVVRRIYEAAAKRDADTVLSLYDPDIVWDMSRSDWGRVMGSGVYEGHEGLQAFYQHWREAFGSYDEKLDDLTDAGDRVVVTATGRGRGRASGASVEWSQYGVWTIREGKVLQVLWFANYEEALEAAGLSE